MIKITIDAPRLSVGQGIGLIDGRQAAGFKFHALGDVPHDLPHAGLKSQKGIAFSVLNPVSPGSDQTTR